MSRRKMQLVCSTALLVMLGLTVSARAQQPQQKKGEPAGRVGDVYPLSVDPVTGEDLSNIKQPVVLLHDGRELHFADKKNADKFKADPDAYLPKVDQLIIEQQTPLYPLDTCVVSGEKLGGDMGKPVDFVYGNRLVRFCCPACVATFKKDPARYLDQINAAVIEQQTPEYPMDTCLVSGEKLSEMGKPIDYLIGNRLVRFCCSHCRAAFERNPAHYLAKLNHESEHGEHEGAQAEEHGHVEHGRSHERKEHGEHEDHDDND